MLSFPQFMQAVAKTAGRTMWHTGHGLHGAVFLIGLVGTAVFGVSHLVENSRMIALIFLLVVIVIGAYSLIREAYQLYCKEYTRRVEEVEKLDQGRREMLQERSLNDNHFRNQIDYLQKQLQEARNRPGDEQGS